MIDTIIVAAIAGLCCLALGLLIGRAIKGEFTLNMRDLIGIGLTVAFVGAMVMLLWKAIPRENEQLLSYMLGQLSGFVAGVVGYHYITKAGEKELEQKRAENTGEALKAINAAQGGPAAAGAVRVAEAAEEKAEEIREEGL